ncbi:TldD/PmbA family protein [Robiginitomaculum antarcticum]|uniref:TldD/PmbA family protein n=1 Tax=Robiginitomaculum antarcticum TaxID=437507 RepID=UPI0003612821|nr:TldD/PmbA family protein [Robiginitomaculum antarcticum]
MSQSEHSDAPSPEGLSADLNALLSHAKRFGASSADAIATHGQSLSVSVKGGAIEDVDSSEGRDIGLRVMIGKRMACVSSSDSSPASLERLAQRAVAMAKLAPEDPYCALPDPDLLAQRVIDLDIFDHTAPDIKALQDTAREVEAAACAVAKVQQAEGASASTSAAALFYASSDGFARGYRSTRHGRSVAAIASDADGMERDYDMSSARHSEDLRSAAEVGRKAGMRASARLGGTQVPSGKMPVIFDRRISGSLLSALAGAISGPAITRGTSFLRDKRGETLFGDSIHITDDPFMPRGLGSRPFDGEGLPGQKHKIIDGGVLTTWMLNTSSGLQLGLPSTGHAFRSIGGAPGVGSTNFVMAAGRRNVDAIMADIGAGVLITEMFGPSLNSNTGDYSVGVSGYKIENGARGAAVREITVAGNLLEIFRVLEPADDLIIESSTTAPSLLLGDMTVAGG